MVGRLGRLRDKGYRAVHKIRLAWLGRGKTGEYRAYLKMQYERTFAKKTVRLQSPLLIDRLAAYLKPETTVLCLGSRNTDELNYLRSKGVKNVIGIDLYSETPDILVMDMHALKFPDAHFDAIYSSHSLEHAYDAQQVIREITRVARNGAVVAIEVPIRYETRGADRIDFQSPQHLIDQFQPHVGQILVSEDHPPFSEANRYGNDIARVIFTIQK